MRRFRVISKVRERSFITSKVVAVVVVGGGGVLPWQRDVTTSPVYRPFLF